MFDELIKQLRAEEERAKREGRADFFALAPDAGPEFGDFHWTTGEKADRVDERAMVVGCTISTEKRDRSREIVSANGCDLTNHKKNPIVLFDHIRTRPIGTAESPAGTYTVKQVGNSLVAETHFFKGDEYAEEVFKMIATKALRGCSIGFRTSYKDISRTPDDPGDVYGPATYTISKCELLEYSHVMIPDNPDALVDYVKDLKSGRPVHDLIRRRLEPVAGPLLTKRFFQGADLPKPDPTPPPVTPPGGVKEVVKYARPLPPRYDGPAGAQAIAKAHDLFLLAGTVLTKGALDTESEVVQALLGQVAGGCDQLCAQLVKHYQGSYKHLRPLMPDGYDTPRVALATGIEGDVAEGQKSAFDAMKERVKAAEEWTGGVAPTGWTRVARSAAGALAEAAKALANTPLGHQLELAANDLSGASAAAEAPNEWKAKYEQAVKDNEALQKAAQEAIAESKKVGEIVTKLLKGQTPPAFGDEANEYKSGRW